jgi:DNA-binding XRE family transcriptional regulator
MARTKKKVDKEQLRQRRAELYEAISGGKITLQEAVKEMRAISQLTQAGFAAHRGVSTKVIKEIENGTGNPTIVTLNRIGAFFGLEVAFVRTETLREQKNASIPPSIQHKEPREITVAELRAYRQAMKEFEKLLGLHDIPRQK